MVGDVFYFVVTVDQECLTSSTSLAAGTQSEGPLTRHGVGHQSKEAVVFCLNLYGRRRRVWLLYSIFTAEKENHAPVEVARLFTGSNYCDSRAGFTVSAGATNFLAA